MNKIICQNRYVELETPPPSWKKNILSDVHMNTFIHNPVSPLLVDIASYYQYTRQ